MIADAERRRRLTASETKKVEAELAELKARLAEAQHEEKQLRLPLEARTRGLSDKWAAVLSFMVLRSPHPVSIDEILAFAARNHLTITRAAVRAQLYNYAQRGLVERLSDGLYVATANAKAFCDY